MKGDRQWFIDTQNELNKIENTRNFAFIVASESSVDNHAIYKQMMIQGKKLSQIICYIWAYQDSNDAEKRETAQKLDQIFKSANDSANDGLKKLLFSSSQESTDEYNLLLKIFKPADLPIFASGDKKFIKFKLDKSSFQGKIDDPQPPDELLETMTIPYPPSPEIADNGTEGQTTKAKPRISESDLNDWLNQPPDNEPFYSNNRYIPSTSS